MRIKQFINKCSFSKLSKIFLKMFLKLPALLLFCVCILPIIESAKPKPKRPKDSSDDNMDWDTCDFQGYDGPDNDKKPKKKNKVRLGVSGPVPSVFTPFTEEGEINYSVIPKYVEYLNKTGAKAIFVGSLTGQFSALSLCEKKEVISAFVYIIKKYYRIKIIVQVGGTELPDVIALASHAEKLEVDAIVALPPFFYQTGRVKSVENDIIWYLSIVSKFAPSIPLLYYDIPEFTGVVVEKIRELHVKLTQVVVTYRGMLTSYLVALEIADLVGRGQIVFITSHHVLSPALMGFYSTISPVFNVALPEVYKILKAGKTGAIKKARAEQLALNKVTAEITAIAKLIPGIKASMELTTPIKVGPMRPPVRPLTEKDIKCIREVLEKNKIETNDD